MEKRAGGRKYQGGGFDSGKTRGFARTQQLSLWKEHGAYTHRESEENVLYVEMSSLRPKSLVASHCVFKSPTTPHNYQDYESKH
jgi:hypothetical protein